MGRRIRLTDGQRRELWARWKRGETSVEIGRALERSTPNVFNIIRASGGIGAAGAPREGVSADGAGARGDLAWACGGTVCSGDRPWAETKRLDRKP